MCRQNVLLGWILAAFGLGLLIGKWVSGGFFFHCLGLGLIIFGLLLMRKR